MTRSPFDAFGREEPPGRAAGAWGLSWDPPGLPSYRVLYGEPIPEDLAELANSVLPLGFELRVVVGASHGELVREVPNADFLIVATSGVDEEVVTAGKRLRLIQAQGVGYNNIDLAACERAGVPVAINTGGDVGRGG